MTNYEKIMNDMTVEKLAVLLSENYLDNPCQYCMRFNKQDSACSVCADGIAEWLKQEAIDAIEERKGEKYETD